MGFREVLNIEAAQGLYTVHFTDCQHTYDEEEMQDLISFMVSHKQYLDARKLLKALI